MTKIFKYLLAQIKPRFWESQPRTIYFPILYNYRRIWIISIILLIMVALVPVNVFGIISYRRAREAFKTETNLRTVRLTSNARRTLSYFLEERLDVLRFIVHREELKNLKNEKYLAKVLVHLQEGFGGYVDLGVIDNTGKQIAYVGPYELGGKDYSYHKWFKECKENGAHISDVFLGYRNVWHLIVAIKSPGPDDHFYILRATLDMKRINNILSSMELGVTSEAFLCTREGLLQTPSKYYGKMREIISLPVPEFSLHSQILETKDDQGKELIIGYAYIDNSPFILMLIKRTKDIMQNWYTLRSEMILLMLGSTIIILLVIIGVSAYMVNRVYDADQTRIQIMHDIENTNRFASIGRLATGVAHEINNPLAVINENAGLIQDLFTITKEFRGNPRLLELLDAVLESVDRCGEITKQLLGFARQFESKPQPIQLNLIIEEVLNFLRKEATYRNIDIDVNIPQDLPVIFSDHGSLQQIFLNLINNSFQGMEDGGHIEIWADRKNEGHVIIHFYDNGCGISPNDQEKIFEPFFTTKAMNSGTGLGLYITYGLVHKLQGEISLQSEVSEGTIFCITLPIKAEGGIENESLAG